MNEDEILLSVGLELDKIRKQFKSIESIVNTFDKSNKYFDLGLDEKAINAQAKRIYKNIEAEETRIDKMKVSSLKAEISRKTASAKQISDYNERLAKIEYSLRTKELKEIEAKKIASEKWQYNLRVNSIKQENAIALSETKKRLAKEEKAYNKTAAGAWNNGTSFGHKMVTTSMYASAGAALYTMASGFKAVIKESLDFDTAIYKNMAVLNATKTEATGLAKASRDIAIAYGGSIKEIDEVTLTLGRAGVANKDLADASKLTVQMAKITGDTFADTSKVVSTFTTVYADAGYSVEKLGNLLTLAANESKLSTQDLGTLSNYALVTAKSLNLTAESTLALATSFSRLGINASTIGTQIRKLDVLLSSSSKKMNTFWEELGMNQDKTAAAIREGGRGGEQALEGLIVEIAGMTDKAFRKSTSGMEILTKQLLNNLRLSKDMYIDYTKDMVAGGADLELQSRVIAQSTENILQRISNQFLSISDGWISSVSDVAFSRKEIGKLDEAVKSSKVGTKEYKDAISALKEALDENDEAIKNFVENVINIGKYLGIATAAYVAFNIASKSYLATAPLISASIKALALDYAILTTTVNGATISMRNFNAMSLAGKAGLIGLGAGATAYAIDSIHDYSKGISGVTEQQKRYAEQMLKNEEIEKRHIENKKSLDKILKADPALAKEYDLRLQLSDLMVAQEAQTIRYNKLKDKPFDPKFIEAERIKFEALNNAVIDVENSLKELDAIKIEDAISIDASKFIKSLEDISDKTDEMRLSRIQFRMEEAGGLYNDAVLSGDEKNAQKYFDIMQGYTIDWLKLNNKVQDDITKVRQKSNDNQTKSRLEFQRMWNESEEEDRQELQKTADLRKALDAEGIKFAMENAEKRISLETDWHQLQKDNFDSMLDSQISLISGTNSWGDSLSGIASEYSNIGKEIDSMRVNSLNSTKQQIALADKFNQDYAKHGKDVKKGEKLKRRYAEDSSKISEIAMSNEIKGYGDMAGALSDFVKKGSAEYEILTNIKKGMYIMEMSMQLSSIIGHLSAESTKTGATLASETTKTGAKAASSAIELGLVATTTPVVVAAETTKGQASGLAAIVSSMVGLPFPFNLVAMGATAAAVGALLSQLGGSSSGGGVGASYSVPTRRDIADKNIEDIEYAYTPITDRLDRQISLLESIDLRGSAGRATIDLASSTFERDYKIALEDVLVDINTANLQNPNDVTTVYWDYSTLEQATSTTVGDEFTKSLINAFGDDVITKTIPGFTTTGFRLNPQALKDGTEMLQFLGMVQDRVTNFQGSGIEYFDGFFKIFKSVDDYENAVNQMQEVLGEYANTMTDVVGEMSDAASEFRDLYDSITGTNTYQQKALEDAFIDFKNIKGSDSYSDYLAKQIEAITAVEKGMNVSITNLLLSTNPDDLTAQYEAITKLNLATQGAFSGGVEDALNFIDSISLVGEALASSRENMKSFTDSFKTDEQLLSDMASNLSYTTSEVVRKRHIGPWLSSFPLYYLAEEITKHTPEIAKTAEELQTLFKNLSGGIDGLTDAELEFLDANKELIESGLNDYIDEITDSLEGLDSVVSSLTNIIDELRDAASDSDSSLQKYYSSMKETQELSSDITDSAFVDSLNKTIGFASALFDDSNFSYNRDMVFAQSVAANQFEGMESAALKQIDYLRLIEENTRNELVSLSTGTVPSFEVGTSSVPYNMQANIHRGEIIVPRDFSDGIRSGDLTMGSNGDMSNKLDRNNAIMSEILRTLKDGNDINNASLEVLEDLERIA